MPPTHLVTRPIGRCLPVARCGENTGMETPEERQDQEQADQTAVGGEGGDDRRETEHDKPGATQQDEGGEGNEGEGPAEGDEQ
jgi:hypothetical protein